MKNNQSVTNGTDFHLPSNQQDQILRSRGARTNKTTPVVGSSGSSHLIEAADDNTGRLCLAYIGKLTETTSTQYVRDHLRDIVITHVAVVIQKACKAEGGSSLFISVDSVEDEDIIYMTQNWPQKTRIRECKVRPLHAATDSNQHHGYEGGAATVGYQPPRNNHCQPLLHRQISRNNQHYRDIRQSTRNNYQNQDHRSTKYDVRRGTREEQNPVSTYYYNSY